MPVMLRQGERRGGARSEFVLAAAVATGRCARSLVGDTGLASASRRRLLEERPVLGITPRAVDTESCQGIDLRIEFERLRERRLRPFEVADEAQCCGEPKMRDPWPRVCRPRFDQQL